MNLNVDKIYVCHWNKLSERKKYIKKHFDDNGIYNYEWVENYDKEKWNKQYIELEYPYIFGLNPFGRYLRESEISLLLKHCHIIKDAYQNNYSSILIFEDDVELKYDFINRFNKYKSKLPKSWDICWVGSCCGLESINVLDDVNVYSANTSRCTHCYIINKTGIEKIYKDLINVNETVDWWYNIIIPKLELKTYWFEPSLASQNSEFKSTLENKK